MKNATDINILLDRSGSMTKIKNDMIGGYQTFIDEQKRFTGDECRVSLYQFDDRYETVFENKLVSEVPALDLRPRGWTCLIDALGRTITSVGERLSKLPENERPARVVFVVITDGEENRSKEFTQKAVADMIKLQQDTYQWRFVFLGANQDSYLTSKNLNINAATVMDFSPNEKAISNSYRSLSRNVASFRGGDTNGLCFSAFDRKEALVK